MCSVNLVASRCIRLSYQTEFASHVVAICEAHIVFSNHSSRSKTNLKLTTTVVSHTMIHSAKKRRSTESTTISPERAHSKVCRKSNTTQRSLEFRTKRKRNLYFSKYRVTLIVNIYKQNWKTVANVAFKHEQIRPELSETLRRTVNAIVKIAITILHLISYPQFTYDLFHMHHSLTYLSREHMNPQLTCSQRQWLHSSVGRASHRYREVTGSSPVEVLNFFQASLRNCINCDHNCEDHSSFDLTRNIADITGNRCYLQLRLSKFPGFPTNNSVTEELSLSCPFWTAGLLKELLE